MLLPIAERLLLYSVVVEEKSFCEPGGIPSRPTEYHFDRSYTSFALEFTAVSLAMMELSGKVPLIVWFEGFVFTSPIYRVKLTFSVFVLLWFRRRCFGLEVPC